MSQQEALIRIRRPAETDLPARSRLYHLVPLEVRTIWCESLTGYINRLGWAHHVSPRAMVTQEIIPSLSKRLNVSDQWIGALSRGSAMNINGVGSLASEWTQILQQLTKRYDLHFLTLHGWVGDLASRGHLRASPAWCRVCYAEWREKEQPVYQPLLWMFRVVTTCPRHCQSLESYCPSCQKTQSVIALKTFPGHCTQCNEWLGIPSGERAPQNRKGEADDWQQWVLQALEELQSVSMADGKLRWEPFFTNLAMGFNAVTDVVSWEKIERFTGIKALVLNQWARREKTPSLETVLKLCYACEVTPLQIMRGEMVPLRRMLQREIPSRTPLRRAEKPRVDRERCLELIHAVLDGREKPLGLRQLTERLGCGHRALLDHFPEECASITQQAREYRKQQSELRIRQVREKVRQHVFSLHTQGIYPSQKRLRTVLPGGFMRQLEAKEAWRAALRELGFEV